MLTAAQCKTVAYSTPWGEFFCAECTVGRLESDGGSGVEGFEPVIAVSLDEYQGEMSADLQDQGDYPDCTDQCSPYAVDCESCGAALVEPYHYGHEVADDDVDHPVYPEDTP